MHRAHWFDGNPGFYDTFPTYYSKMHFSMRWHRLFEHRSPIDIPTDEDCAWITCDCEQKWLPACTRRVDESIDIRR